MNISDQEQFKLYVRGNEIKTASVFIEQKRGSIRFNTSAVKLCNLKVGDRIAFIELGEDWYIAKTNEKNGYLLSNTWGNRSGLRCTATFIAKQLRGRYHVNELLLISTKYDYHSSTVYKLYKK